MGTVGIRWGMLAMNWWRVTRENVIGDELWFPQPPSNVDVERRGHQICPTSSGSSIPWTAISSTNPSSSREP